MDIRELDRRAINRTGEIIRRLTDEQLDLPTPCSEWTVRQMVGHMVDNNIAAVARVLGDPVPPSRPSTGHPWQAFHDTGKKHSRTFASDEVLTAPYEMGQFGTFTGQVALNLHFLDVFVHGWDIERAIGLAGDLDEDLATAALRISSALPDTPQLRGGKGDPFDVPKPVAEDAPVGHRLVALLGRDPSWRPLQKV